MIRITNVFCLPVLFFLLLPAAHAADALCPDLEELRATAPSDMAGVQADIDRMKLCVQRAQLLQELDKVAQERQKILDEANGVGSKNNGSGNASLIGGVGGIPPLPVSQLPPLKTNAPSPPPSALQPGTVQVTNAAAGALGSVTDQLAQMSGGSGGWSVRKIWGQGGMTGAGMRAQLVNGTGTILNVAKGDSLPDGSVVESLSVKGVALSQNGKVTDVQWEQGAAAQENKTK